MTKATTTTKETNMSNGQSKGHLLPCPFCGCANPDLNEVEFSIVIMCSGKSGCNASVSAIEEVDAKNKWNKRTCVEPCDGCDSAPADCVGSIDCERLKP